MDKDLQEYYEERFKMMVSKGWLDLIEDAQKLHDQYNSLNSVEDEKTLNRRKGQLDILNWILTLKNVSQETYNELENNEEIL
jgi:hypothetical protein|tara:strand:+ start:4846 stop:5091 length:246 start_codon:yes stop_codon:yes gene_type:complete